MEHQSNKIKQNLQQQLDKHVRVNNIFSKYLSYYSNVYAVVMEVFVVGCDQIYEHHKKDDHMILFFLSKRFHSASNHFQILRKFQIFK